MKVVILAGGKGQRLWPISRKNFPKQFLRFGENQSLLQKTVSRFIEAPFCEGIYVLTSKPYKVLVEKQLDALQFAKKIEILCEPSSKNTGPAIAYAISELKKNSDCNEEVLIIPSDHYIDPKDDFFSAVEKSRPFISRGKIVTFGIKPLYAETGYGYIRLGDPISRNFHQVSAFVEKPQRDVAESFIQEKIYLWNSGIYAFSLRTFVQECKKYSPMLLQDFSKMDEVSIDYALMEKSNALMVSTLDLCWSDLGSWQSIYAILDKDVNQNVKVGDVHASDTKNCLIMSSKKIVATLGVDDLVIIETDKVIFVAKKGETTKLKQLIQQAPELNSLA